MARIGPWMVSVNGVAYEFVTYDLNGPFPNSAGVYMLDIIMIYSQGI